MRVYISSPGEKTIHLVIPNWLFFNRLTAPIIVKVLRKYVATAQAINKQDLKDLLRELYRLNRKYAGMNLVEMESADGEIVRIRL